MTEEIRAEDRYRAACGRIFHSLRTQRNWSLREFGEHAGAAHTTLYAIERGDAVPGIDILDRAAVACGLDLATLMRLIIDQLDPIPNQTPLVELLRSLEELSPDQRREVLSYAGYLEYRDRATGDA